MGCAPGLAWSACQDGKRCSAAVLVALWCCSGAILVVFWWCSGAALVLFWSCSGAVLVLFWGCSGAVLVLFWVLLARQACAWLLWTGLGWGALAYCKNAALHQIPLACL